MSLHITITCQVETMDGTVVVSLGAHDTCINPMYEDTSATTLSARSMFRVMMETLTEQGIDRLGEFAAALDRVPPEE